MKYLVNILVVLSLMLHRPCPTDASSKPQNKELNKSNYTLLGLTIGECSRRDILSKLGPTLIVNDEQNADNDYLCYISDRDGTLILFGFKENRYARFRMMSRKDNFYKWHFCADSPLVTEQMSTASGITLGMPKNRLVSILGTPNTDTDGRLFYDYKWKKPAEKAGNRKGSSTVETGSSIPLETGRFYVEARFIDSGLISLNMEIIYD